MFGFQIGEDGRLVELGPPGKCECENCKLNETESDMSFADRLDSKMDRVEEFTTILNHIRAKLIEGGWSEAHAEHLAMSFAPRFVG